MNNDGDMTSLYMILLNQIIIDRSVLVADRLIDFIISLFHFNFFIIYYNLNIFLMISYSIFVFEL